MWLPVCLEQSTIYQSQYLRLLVRRRQGSPEVYRPIGDVVVVGTERLLSGVFVQLSLYIRVFQASNSLDGAWGGHKRWRLRRPITLTVNPPHLQNTTIFVCVLCATHLAGLDQSCC